MRRCYCFANRRVMCASMCAGKCDTGCDPLENLIRLLLFRYSDDDAPGEEDWTCDCWFKPRKPWRRDFTPIQWTFPWNDRRKPVYKESNCFMVPSKMEEKIRARRAATSAVHKKEDAPPHTRSLTPTPRPKNQPGPNLLESVLRPRGPPPRDD